VSAFNRTILIGNLTRDPETKHLQSGTAVCDVGLAVNDRVKRGNEYLDEVSFLDVVFFGRTAEVAGEFLAKGSCVLVEGRLKQERWEKDGQKRSAVKVIGDRLVMLDRKEAAPVEAPKARGGELQGVSDAQRRAGSAGKVEPTEDNTPF
jgi:single-strand DNA-binding protein